MSEKCEQQVDRREVLKGVAAAGFTTVFDPVASALAAAAVPRRDLIRTENAKPGTTDWLLRNTRVDPKTKYRCPWIEGYCSHNSIRTGETL